MLVCLLTGCASPVEINDRYAVEQGLTRTLVKGTDFTHVVYTGPDGEGALWHIYIEGDGRPWRSRTSVAHDPTSALPLMLRSMQMDGAPSLYLGRPCYLGQVREAACKPWVWTHGRYSEVVVESLRVALKRLIAKHGIKELVLIGHSGGGTLAMLLAERVAQTSKVVTLAGNLDIRAWTKKHDYSMLTDSMNPADRQPLPDSIQQYHFLGAGDHNIPSRPLDEGIRGYTVIDGVGHTNGWEEVYSDILELIDH